MAKNKNLKMPKPPQVKMGAKNKVKGPIQEKRIMRDPVVSAKPVIG